MTYAGKKDYSHPKATALAGTMSSVSTDQYKLTGFVAAEPNRVVTQNSSN
jgi:hypothetical protein